MLARPATNHGSNQGQHDAQDGVVSLLPGQILKRARDEKGFTEEYIIGELKLESSLFAALEADDFERLPPPTFVRGYLRQYANLVGIDSVKLIAIYETATGIKGTAPLIEGRAYGASKVSRWAFPHPYVSIISLLLIATFVVVELIWERIWVDHVVVEETLQQSLPPEAKLPNGSKDVVAELPPSPEDILVAKEVAVLESVVAEQTEREILEAQQGRESLLGTESVDADAQPSAEREQFAAFEESVPLETDQALSTAASDAAWGKLSLKFSDFTWVDIRDADGVRVIVGNFPAGLVRNAQGRLPFKVEIGNAKGVAVQLNDQQVDLAPYLRGDVAKFTLEAR